MYSCILQTKKICKCEFKLQIKEWKKEKKKKKNLIKQLFHSRMLDMRFVITNVTRIQRALME